MDNKKYLQQVIIRKSSGFVFQHPFLVNLNNISYTDKWYGKPADFFGPENTYLKNGS